MSELAAAHWEACTPGTPRLPDHEADALSAQVAARERDVRALRRELTFSNFHDAFVARVALVAEAQGSPDAVRRRRRGEDRPVQRRPTCISG
jgi:hypothetical protein